MKRTTRQEGLLSLRQSLAAYDLSSISKDKQTCPGLYLAGEVLDIDGVTGGFNVQAA